MKFIEQEYKNLSNNRRHKKEEKKLKKSVCENDNLHNIMILDFIYSKYDNRKLIEYYFP